MRAQSAMLVVVVALSVAGLAAAATASVVDVEVNLLANPGFEEVVGEDPVGWTRYTPQGSRAGLVLSRKARTGEYAALVDAALARAGTNHEAARLDWNQRFRNHADGRAKPGELYRFSVWYRTEGDPKGRLGVERLEMPNVYLNLAPSREWTYAEIEFTWPEESEWGVVVGLWSWLGTEGRIWFDDAALVRVEPSPNAREEQVQWVPRTDALPTPYRDVHGVVREYVDRAERVALVDNVPQLQAALAQVGPGDVILLRDGTYSGDTALFIEEKAGTSDRPIVIAAENIGKAVIAGRLQFIVKGSSYVVIEGLDFQTEGGSDSGYSGRRAHSAVILHDAYRARITRNRFALKEAYGGSSLRDWLSVDGSKGGYNRIDHNLFEGKVHNGSFISVNADLGRSEGLDTTPRHTRIDHNHFRNMAPLGINGMEAIRLGSSGYRDAAHIDAGTIFEFNLLEHVDGERSEIISIKDSGNIIRYNTIFESAGAIVFRFGHRNWVYGNYILGNGKEGTGGLRIYGAEQRIFNNYLSGLVRPAVDIGRGNIEEPHDLPRGELYYSGAEYVKTNDVHIVFNTFVDNQADFALSGDRPLEPENVWVANNLLTQSRSSSAAWDYRGLLAHPGITWLGNIAHGYHFGNHGLAADSSPGGDEQAFLILDPRLALGIDGVYYPDSASPVQGAAAEAFVYVRTDIEGKRRDGRPDVGAFEYAGFPLVRGPLTADDVGPFAIGERNELSLDEPALFITAIELEGAHGDAATGWGGTLRVRVDGVSIGELNEGILVQARVGEREVYRGPGLPAAFQLDTSTLDEGRHELVVLASSDQVEAKRRFPFDVRNIVIRSPAGGERVKGEWPLSLSIFLDDDVVQSVSVLVDGEPFFRGPSLPDGLTLPSLTLADGRHTLAVEVKRADGGLSRTESTFTVENYWTLRDELQPPVDFFGQKLVRMRTHEASSGWVHATDHPTSFLGDADRLIKEGDHLAAYLVWQASRLKGAVVTVYTLDDRWDGSGIALAVSADGEHFEPVAHTLRSVEVSAGGWRKVELVVEVPSFEEVHYLRLTWSADGPSRSELQIGRVELTGLIP